MAQKGKFQFKTDARNRENFHIPRTENSNEKGGIWFSCFNDKKWLQKAENSNLKNPYARNSSLESVAEKSEVFFFQQLIYKGCLVKQWQGKRGEYKEEKLCGKEEIFDWVKESWISLQ